jgi:hypothetical protein
MRWSEIINETSTAGATSAGCIATVVGGKGPAKGGIGAGFDPNGHKGIYDAAERKKAPKKVKKG